MAYCAICGNYHYPDLSCDNETRQALRGAGIEESTKKPSPEFRKTAKLADRFMMKVLISVLAAIVLFVILAKIFATLP